MLGDLWKSSLAAFTVLVNWRDHQLKEKAGEQLAGADKEGRNERTCLMEWDY